MRCVDPAQLARRDREGGRRVDASAADTEVDGGKVLQATSSSYHRGVKDHAAALRLRGQPQAHF